MLIIDYNPNDIFKFLKHYDWKYRFSDFLWRTDIEFQKEQIERITINGWSEVNNYYYYFNEFSKHHVYNLLNFSNIFKGVVFTENVFDHEDFPTIENFCNEHGINIILLSEANEYDIQKIFETE